MLDPDAVASLAPLKIYLPLYLNCKIPEILYAARFPPIVILLLDVIKENPVPFTVTLSLYVWAPVVLTDDSNITSPVTDIEGSVVPLVVLNVGVLLAVIVGELPKALSAPAIKVPLDKAIAPVKLLLPLSVKFPLPDFVIPPLPEIAPDNVCAELELKVNVPALLMPPA